ncbi:MAG: hypothetical protein FJ023_09710 [Chloroflexi bacterium]|nr:hypothetical protein [Chloroflexota bacterium]
MKKMIKKFGKLITASFIIMGVGIISFPLVIPMYGIFGIDTDWFSVFIFLVGAIIGIVGLIRREKRSRILLIALLVFVSIMCMPILFGVVAMICYFITGKELGW